MSKRRRDFEKKDGVPYAQLGILGGVVALLVAVILIMSGGSEDPVAKQLIPPVDLQSGTTSPEEEVTPYTSQAIDGATPPPVTPEDEQHDHSDHASETKQPKDAATETGGMIEIARKFAQLNINRPTNPLAAEDLNEKLIKLSIGTLARDLANGTGSMAAAQIPSTGEILSAVPLARDGKYGEVLIVSKTSITDVETGQPLDPSYINYLVRLERLPDGTYAVTSWEPQL